MSHQELLTIGNSFADNALTYLRQIGEPLQFTWTIGRANIGGCPLEKHWNLHRYSDATPDFVTYNDGAAIGDDPRQGTLRQMLVAREWDVVTLQQASVDSWCEETYRPWLDKLIGLVRELAPQAEILLHHTWAYRSDAPLLAEWQLTTRQMHERICVVYADLVAELGLRTLPTGPALQQAREQGPDGKYELDAGYNFDQPEPPALPRQVNNHVIGYWWEAVDTLRGIHELRLDPKHLNVRGCYVASATWFETLTGRDVCTSSFCPLGLDEEDQRFLAGVAHDAVVATR